MAITPGEWKVLILSSELGESYRIYAERDGGKDVDIAHIPLSWANRDNARLIVNAPKLLRSAQKLLWAIGKLDTFPLHLAEYIYFLQDDVDAATGEYS